MKYISLSNSSLSVFIAKGKISEMSGSSKYQVFDSEIVRKPKQSKNRIENTTALRDYNLHLITDNLTDDILERIKSNYEELLLVCKTEKFTSETKLDRLELLKSFIDKSNQHSKEFPFKHKLIEQHISQENSRYKKRVVTKLMDKQINKSKVKGKMYALFNLSCSRKFIAFYSVSFPIGINDDKCFALWNNWLTILRKRFELSNYVWITERQKNGTLHFHMLTNNYMPIKSINRVMAICINNKVLLHEIEWGKSSLEKYNGVDVDAVYNSKRHKRSGKQFNSAELRNWLTKYLTKYITKNTEKFKHLCWHCSRSVSQLFTAQIELFENRRKFTDYLPTLSHMYYQVKSTFNHTCVFKFVPVQNIFDKIKMYNDWLFVEYEPQANKQTLKINLNIIQL